MKKYILRYLFFWFPAFILSLIPSNGPILSVFRWFFGFFMLFGWIVNTGMAAYHRPRGTISFLLAFTGINAILIFFVYTAFYDSPIYRFLRLAGGTFTYIPLSSFYNAILDFNIMHEMYILGLLMAGCLVGLIFGLIQRKINPSPYEPRIIT